MGNRQEAEVAETFPASYEQKSHFDKSNGLGHFENAKIKGRMRFIIPVWSAGRSF